MKRTMFCTVDGCGKDHLAQRLCGTHYARVQRTGGLVVGPYSGRGNGAFRPDGYTTIQRNNTRRFAHSLVAEKALGKPLPAGAVVHHVDEDRSNNQASNLVICPDQAYHMLLHQRMRAMDVCGNPNWRSCRFCGQYDDPKNLYVQKYPGRLANHRSCQLKDYYQRKNHGKTAI